MAIPRCKLCNEYTDDCDCPACPVCGAHGCDNFYHAKSLETEMQDTKPNLIYTVDSMEGKQTKTGSTYSLKLGSNNPDYQCTLLAVTKEQFDSVSVGDQITVAVSLFMEAVPVEALAGESEKESVQP